MSLQAFYRWRDGIAWQPDNDGAPYKADTHGLGTAWGVSEPIYEAWVHAHPGASFPRLMFADKGTLSAIIYAWYWKAMDCDYLPNGIDAQICDAGFMSGPGHSVMVAQQIVGMTVDGVMGRDTRGAILAYTNQQDFIDKFYKGYSAFLLSIGDSVDIDGWTRRAYQARNVCLQWNAGNFQATVTSAENVA